MAVVSKNAPFPAKSNHLTIVCQVPYAINMLIKNVQQVYAKQYVWAGNGTKGTCLFWILTLRKRLSKPVLSILSKLFRRSKLRGCLHRTVKCYLPWKKVKWSGVRWPFSPIWFPLTNGSIPPYSYHTIHATRFIVAGYVYLPTWEKYASEAYEAESHFVILRFVICPLFAESNRSKRSDAIKSWKHWISLAWTSTW